MRFREAVVFVGVGLACDAPSSDCPEADTADLVCPVEIAAFTTSACGPTPGDYPVVGIDVAVEGNTLHVSLSEIGFRDNNEICGFAERRESDISVLLQPCTLIPEGGVSKGDCWYDTIAFDVTNVDLSGAATLTVFHRVDNSPELPPDAPREVASAEIR